MRYLFAFALLILLASPALAKDNYPDYLTLGAGAYDFDKTDHKLQSADFRGEYRWGLSLVPLVAPGLRSGDKYVQLHPMAGAEVNSRAALMGWGGLNLDFPILHPVVLTWGEAVGAYEPGQDTQSLGSVIEYRSQLELGWQFSGAVRATGYISHISNDGIAQRNPGAEVVGFYIHLPLWHQ